MDLCNEDVLALRAATAPVPVAAQSWVELMTSMRFDEVNENTQRVIPAIFRNLRAVHDVPDRDRLRGAFKYVWSRNTELLHGVRPVLAELDERGVDHRLLKGSAVQIVCDSLGARIMGDIDILVRAEDVDRVCAVMAGCGFRRGTHSECAGHADADHDAALNFNSGDFHVDVHVAERKPPVRLLTLMMAAPAQRRRVAGLLVPVPPAELLLLHAAEHGCLASGPTDFVQAVADMAMLLPHTDRGILVRAARRTGTLAQLLEIDRAVVTAGAESLGIAVPWTERASSSITTASARLVDAVSASSSLARRVRTRQRGRAALRRVDAEFLGRRRAYHGWLRLGQLAAPERLFVGMAGGFLPTPAGVWESASTAKPFDGQPVPGIVGSTVASSTLDWRFRVRFAGPQRRARLVLESDALNRLDAFVFCNGEPVHHVFAGDPTSRVIGLRDLPASCEFSVRPLWRVCASCYQGLGDLSVRIDLGDDAQ